MVDTNYGCHPHGDVDRLKCDLFLLKYPWGANMDRLGIDGQKIACLNFRKERFTISRTLYLRTFI